ncbi:MAG: efflux RND transporter periplasmic adaptor subunit [Nitrospirota bacterium]|nr:efflux RND transporter periplasmic adaptor subunit [Nitrospirota bacterium]
MWIKKYCVLNKSGIVGVRAFFTVWMSLFLICSCGKSGQPVKKEGVPVAVSTVVQKTVPVQIRAIGNVEAYSTVSVKSQIGGELLRIHFKEGQDVKKGALLFTIDPRSYEAALKQAEANLARDTAQLENARVDARRYAELVKKGYVAQQQYDQVQTNAAALEATVLADKAAVENAKLQLSYCFIHAPLNGRTGSLLSHQGDMIKANADNPMVVINQIQPIYVTFSVPEQNLKEIKKYMTAGKLKVEAIISGYEDSPAQGIITFVDNTVDISTGTIKLKGTFENNEKRLWPGQFVNVVLTLTAQPDAVVVPSQAVQTGQEGLYVFIVKSDLTVESRPVVTGINLGGEVVIEKGLKPGEQVVTDGQLRLVPGAKVEIKSETKSTSSGSEGKPQ